MAEMSLIEQAASMIGALLASVKDKQVVARPETVRQRAEICTSCPKLKVKRGKYSCVTCGCSFKRKIAAHGASCPLGKWGVEPTLQAGT